MLNKLTFLHLRWFGQFVFVGLLMNVFGHMQEGNLKLLATAKYYHDLVPMLMVCGILAIIVPWIMFMIDPRRTSRAASLENFLIYWKVK